MKRRTSIEEELKSVNPDPKKEHDLSTPNKLLQYYFDATGVRASMEKNSTRIKPDIKQMSASWENIQWMLGVVYRIHSDGYDILRMIGLTPDETQSFSVLTSKIRTLAASYQENPGTNPTKMLYDQIKQLS